MGLRVLKVIGLGLLLLAVAVPGFVLLNSRDLADPGDEDLRVERLDIADAANAYPHVEAAAAALVWPEDDDAHEEQVRAHLLGESWDEEFVAELLAANREPLEELALAVAAPHFQVPEYASPWDDLPESMMVWTRVAKLGALRAQARARDGRDEPALADALAVATLGHRLEGARGAVLIHTMLGVAIKSIGLAALERSLPHVEIDAYAARRLAGELGALRSDPEGWAGMWAGEYQSMKSVFVVTAGSPENVIGEAMGSAAGEDDFTWSSLLPSHYLYHPNRTLRIYGDMIRSFRADSAGTCDGLSVPPEIRADTFSTVATAVSPNGVGKILMRIAVPNFLRFQVKRCASDSRVAAMQAQVALRAYSLEHGSLPETLSALVPEYLAALPVDGFDGATLRYSADSRRLWSVGSDLADSAGEAQDDPLLEPSFPIVF